MRARWALASLAALVCGCAAVEEEPAASATSPVEAPSQVAVSKPASPQQPEAVPEPKTVESAPRALAEPPKPSETEQLVAEFARLRRLPPAELAREQEAARQAFNQTRSDSARVRLAMTLALPGGAAADDGRILELLDPLVKTPGASLHALALLIATYVQEQRRLLAQVNGLQQNVQGLQQNVQGLQQKLDAIKSLERNLSGRGQAARRR